VKSKILTLRIGLASLVTTAVLAVYGEFETIIAFWLLLLCFYPALYFASHGRYFSIKVIVWVGFITQAVTIILFYLSPDSYAFQRHRPFNFTGIESLDVSFRLGMFLVVMVLIGRILEKFIRDPIATRLNMNYGAISLGYNNRKSNHSAGKVNRNNNFYYIIILIILLIPINALMFDYGIAITGVAPPDLPYKISGISTYLVKFIMPFVLAVLYMRTGRDSLFLVIALGIYSSIIGVSTASRSAAFIVIMAPLVFSVLDRRWLIFLLSFSFFSVAVGLATFSRELVYLSDEYGVYADTSLNIFDTAFEVFKDKSASAFLLIFLSIIGRMASFQEVFLASQMNPDVVGGGLVIFIKSIHWSFIDIDHSTIHLEYLGYTIPLDFYNALGSVYSYVLAASNASPIYILLYSVYLSVLAIICEHYVKVLFFKYELNTFFVKPLMFIFAIAISIGPGNPLNYLMLFIVLSLALLPRIKFIKRLVTIAIDPSQGFGIRARGK